MCPEMFKRIRVEDTYSFLAIDILILKLAYHKINFQNFTYKDELIQT